MSVSLLELLKANLPARSGKVNTWKFKKVHSILHKVLKLAFPLGCLPASTLYVCPLENILGSVQLMQCYLKKNSHNTVQHSLWHDVPAGAATEHVGFSCIYTITFSNWHGNITGHFSAAVTSLFGTWNVLKYTRETSSGLWAALNQAPLARVGHKVHLKKS
jgi:hypothetical protein